MHKIAFLFIALLFSFSSQGQKIRFSDTSNRLTAVKYGFTRTGTKPIHSVRRYFDGDTTIAGKTYQRLNDIFNQKIWVREQADSGKVYQYIDSAEEIFMDYAWQAGDTILYNSQYAKVYSEYRKVYAVDTLSVDGEIYKLFILHGSSSTGYFIEGIGHIGHRNLGDETVPKCFTTNGMKPVMSRFFADFNQGDCSDSSLSVAGETAIDRKLSIYPQPARDKVTITLPAGIPQGMLQIVDAVGTTLYRKSLNNTTFISIEQAFAPGLYLYIISDNTNGTNYSGKILFE